MGAPIGNENAAKGKEWRLAIRRALAHKYGSYSDGLLALAGKLVEAAETGDMQALKELGDREDGKPSQAIVGDASADAVQVETIQRILVRPKD